MHQHYQKKVCNHPVYLEGLLWQHGLPSTRWKSGPTGKDEKSTGW